MLLFSCQCDLSQKKGEDILLTHIISVAGSETTASSLASLINNLLRHPKSFAKLKDEIRSVFKAESEIRLEIANSLPYLNACIEENLRVFPPAPIGFLRSVQKGGDLIDGYFVPENVSTSWPCFHVKDF